MGKFPNRKIPAYEQGMMSREEGEQLAMVLAGIIPRDERFRL
jgi:hypothetical protein